ncbi:hypothetical protein BHM03_00012596 [Ensete ventricosum]|nr:hypothetical protein BHM03_00012596 [Ensete ventricosum]
MGGTYRSARLPVRGPPATGRFHQKSAISGRLRDKSTVGGRLSEKKGGRRRRGKRRKKRKEEKKDLSSVRGPRPCAVAARGSRALFLPHGEKDRGDNLRLRARNEIWVKDFDAKIKIFWRKKRRVEKVDRKVSPGSNGGNGGSRGKRRARRKRRSRRQRP